MEYSSYGEDDERFELKPLPVLTAADVLDEDMEMQDAPTPEAKPKKFSIAEEFIKEQEIEKNKDKPKTATSSNKKS